MATSWSKQTYNTKDYLSMKDIENMMENFGECAELSGTGTGKFKIDPLTGKESIVPTYQWEIVDKLMTDKKNLLNKNLEDLKPILKPIAKDLYYKRKVEYVNLLEQKKKKDDDNIMNMLKKTENVEVISIEDQLKKIMEKEDIKHPLRGEE